MSLASLCSVQAHFFLLSLSLPRALSFSLPPSLSLPRALFHSHFPLTHISIVLLSVFVTFSHDCFLHIPPPQYTFSLSVFLSRWEVSPRVLPRQANHPADQQRRTHHQRRQVNRQPAQGLYCVVYLGCIVWLSVWAVDISVFVGLSIYLSTIDLCLRGSVPTPLYLRMHATDNHVRCVTCGSGLYRSFSCRTTACRWLR